MESGNNKITWDLESIFPNGSASVEFADFRKTIRDDIEKAVETLSDLKRIIDDNSLGSWVELFVLVQYIEERIVHAESFAYCLFAQDVADERAMEILEEVSSMKAAWEGIMTGIEEFAVGTDDDAWNILLNHDELAGAVFYWNERCRIAGLKMDPKLEKLAAELGVNGYHAWCRLYNKTSGDIKVEFVEEGKADILSLGQLDNKFSSADRDIRKQAFEKLSSAWNEVESLAAMALNSQAGYRLSLYKYRGWDSPIFEPLLMCRMKRETIGAMWDAVARGSKKMSNYINAKKKLLGITDFRWYDQVAPLGGVEKTYSYSEACGFVVKNLFRFSADIGSFARIAIDSRWIEAEDRKGKAGGGFCTDLPIKKQTRIFMTFSGNYNEIMTLAHELGHAYHSWVLRDHDHFARQYPMPLAETASTFNELLVTDAALNAASSSFERLLLLDKKIQEGFLMFCNIRARYLFDMMFYNERKNGVVSKQRLSELMIEAQKIAFGNILSEDGYHPTFWASKHHFFETEWPFYNFPYTFGYLFAVGIYDRAKEEGSAFSGVYRTLLTDTGSMTTEEVARKHLEVDLTKDQFWNYAVDRVIEDVDLFVKLAEVEGQGKCI